MSGKVWTYTTIRICMDPLWLYEVTNHGYEEGLVIRYEETESKDMEQKITIGTPAEARAIAKALIQLADELEEDAP